METTTTTRLTAAQRQHLRVAIDQAARANLRTPRSACPECGADLADLPAPVKGCDTCTNRFWRRHQRARTTR